MNRLTFLAIASLAAMSISGCATIVGAGEPARVVALSAANGAVRGSVAVHSRRDLAGPLVISVAGLPAGVHGVHLHEKGVCEGPAFASAGGHWNPASRKHGRENPAGAHLGDLPNLNVGASGRGSLVIPPSVALQGLADADGTSLVVHAKADDYRTDPSGNSGDRIACAVIAPPR